MTKHVEESVALDGKTQGWTRLYSTTEISPKEKEMGPGYVVERDERGMLRWNMVSVGEFLILLFIFYFLNAALDTIRDLKHLFYA